MVYGKTLEKAFPAPTAYLVAGGTCLPHDGEKITGTLTLALAPASDKVYGISEGAKAREELPDFFIEVPSGFFPWTSHCPEEEGVRNDTLPSATAASGLVGPWE